MDRPFRPWRARSWRALYEIRRSLWPPAQQIKYLLTVGPSDGLREGQKRLFTAPVSSALMIARPAPAPRPGFLLERCLGDWDSQTQPLSSQSKQLIVQKIWD